MTDEELIARLRGACYLAFDDGTNDFGTAPEAADRIEALEAKLEHAKKGLRKILRTSDRNSAWDIAIATLAKIKGESHD